MYRLFRGHQSLQPEKTYKYSRILLHNALLFGPSSIEYVHHAGVLYKFERGLYGFGEVRNGEWCPPSEGRLTFDR